MMLLRFFLYLVITGYVFLAPYYLLTRKYSSEYSFSDRLLAAFVVGISQIVLTEVALGFPLKLTTLNLVLVNVAVSTCLVLLAGGGRQEALRQLREARDSMVGFFKMALKHKVLLTILGLSIFQVCWWAFQAYLFPPYAWDELTYHLPKVAYIMQSHGISPFEAYMPVNQTPFTIELVFLWNVIFLKNDILVNATQILFAMAGVLAIYGIARKVGVKPHHAAYATIFLFVPIVIQQATTCYIDLAVSAMFVVAVNFMLSRDKPRANLIITGLSVGIAMGAKGTFILPGLLLSLVLLLLVLRASANVEPVARLWFLPFGKRFAEAFCLYAIPLVLIGGIWFVYFWISYGNPLAPVEVSLFGKTLFHGPLTSGTMSPAPILTNPPAILSAWMERSAPTEMWDYSFYSYDVARGGFGPLFPILLLPSIVFSLFLALKKRSGSYMLAAMVFVLSFLVIPSNWLCRYTIFFCAFGVLAFTVVMQHLAYRRIVAMIALPIVVLTMVMGNGHFFLSPENTLEFIARPLTERESTDLPSRISDYEDYRDLYRKAVEDPGATILYTSVPSMFSYPLWGSSFSNTVAQIPAEYSDVGEFIDRVAGYGESLIITREESDIARYCSDNTVGLEVVYEKQDWRIIAYAGDSSVQEE